MNRVAQPPIQPQLRDQEQPDFWTAFVLALIGLVIAFCGVSHMTNVETTGGGTAWETQLIKAFATGGLHYPPPSAPSPPAEITDLTTGHQPAPPLGQWPASRTQRLKPRVNTGATTPCPT